MKKLFIILSVCFLVSGCGLLQTPKYILSGYTPLRDDTIYLTGKTNMIGEIGETGKFSFSDLEGGTYYLSASGYLYGAVGGYYYSWSNVKVELNGDTNFSLNTANADRRY